LAGTCPCAFVITDSAISVNGKANFIANLLQVGSRANATTADGLPV
jgi:hypothetical protein